MNGNKNSIIDDRLRLCASFVRSGSRLADIGTDHSYLPVWLCRIGRCKSAVAADINPEPLKRGAQTIAEAGLGELVQTRLSDGLQQIDKDEADDIVIAGMGGELIAEIIDSWRYSKDPEKHFILQPMTKSDFLIKWLCENGFEILNQDCCIAANKCYTVILVKFTGKVAEHDDIYYYTGELEPDKNEIHRLFIEKHIDRLTKMARGDSRYAKIAEQLIKASADGGKNG